MMAVDLLITGGVVVQPSGIGALAIAVDGGRIVGLGERRSLPSAREVIDVGGLMVLPGMIDPHVHLGVGGSADDAKLLEDMSTETSAAALGGVSTIVTDHENAHGDSWVTNRLLHDGATLLARAKAEGAQRSPIDFRFTANPDSQDDIAEIPNLVASGVTSFKMFPSYVGEEAAEFGITTVGYDFMYEAFEQIGRCETLERPAQAMVHCEEPSICSLLKERYRAAGAADLLSWTLARPAICEAMQIFDVGMIARETNSQVYIPHVSSAEGGRTIEYLHSRGVRIIGETCAHYLLHDVPWHLGAFGKINPPLRGGDDVEWMWEAMRSGTIEIVGSDNCRYLLEEKTSKDIWDAIPGISDIGATLAVLLTEGVAEGRLSWEQLAAVGATNAARRFGMFPRKGAISVGADADFVVIDPQERWTLGVDVPLSGAEFSFYDGYQAVGRPTMTISRGRVVVQRGELLVEDGGAYVESGMIGGHE